MNGIDKRKTVRFPLELAGHLQVATEQESESIAYITRDICSGGAFFHTDQPIAIGTKVETELVMPIDQLKTIEAKSVLIEVAGTVIRTDENGMAVCFEKQYRMTPVKVEKTISSSTCNSHSPH